MVGLNKISRSLADENRLYKYYFLFTDGLYCWDFHKGEFEVSKGGRRDRGRPEIKDYAYIPIKYLTLVTNTIVSTF